MVVTAFMGVQVNLVIYCGVWTIEYTTLSYLLESTIQELISGRLEGIVNA